MVSRLCYKVCTIVLIDMQGAWLLMLHCRDVDVGRLSVTELQGTTVTAYASGTESTNTSAIPLMDEVYVGGASSMMVAI